MLIKKLLHFFLTLGSSQLLAQNIVGTLSLKANKKAASHIVDYGSGFHTIFFDEVNFEYYRMGYDFSLEKKGAVSLENLGYKARIIEIAANRKEIFIYYSRLDSANIWLLKVNTISGISSKSNTGISYGKSDQIIGNYSIADTSVFYIKPKNEQPKGTFVVKGEPLETFDFNLESEHYNHWQQFVAQYPQLSKTVVHSQHLASENLMQLGSIKHYINHRKISITIDYGFTSLVAQFDRKLKTSSTYKADFNLETVGVPTGGIFGSFLKGKCLYQGALFTSGAVVQKTDLQFEKVSYNQYFPYGYSAGTGSPVCNLNRGVRGTFTTETAESIKVHPTRPVRFLGICITTKGPFEHFSLSEYEPMKTEKEWLNAENAISPTLTRRKNGPSFMFYALQSSSPGQYAFLQHMQGMSSTFFCTLSNTGDKSPYLGKSKMPIANASSYFYESSFKGQLLLYPTVAKINNRALYCFYSKREKKFIFAEI
jgi:hypothetical protein